MTKTLLKKRSFTFLLLVGFLGLVTSNCPDTWVAFEGSCYLFGTDTPLKFFEAEHYCRQHEGHLVHIENAEENKFIKNFLGAFKPAQHWMGLTDERVEGVWKWYDSNNSPNFTDWFPGEPNNSPSAVTSEDCAQFDMARNFYWNDVPCDRLYEPICEQRNTNLEIVG